MKQLRTNFGAKFLAVVLCIACGIASVCGVCYTLRYWDSLFGRGYAESSEFYSERNSYRDQLVFYLDYLAAVSVTGETPTYVQQEQMEAIYSQFSADATNFRFTVRDSETGNLLLSNTGNSALENIEGISGISMSTHHLYEYGLSDSGSLLSLPDNQQSTLPSGTVLPEQVMIEYGVILPPVYEDTFYEGYYSYHQGDPFFVGATVVSLSLTLILLIFLCWAAGHKKGVAGVHRNWQDRIPYDLYLFVLFWMIFGSLALLLVGIDSYFYNASRAFPLLVAIFGATLAVALCLAVLLTTVTRIKSHTLLRNTLIWRLCRVIARGIRSLTAVLPMAWRFAICFVGFLIVNALLALGLLGSYFPTAYLYFGLLVLFNGLVLYGGCRWVAQWRQIRAETAQIVSGDPAAQIDTSKLFHDLKEHADQLNDLGTFINHAVEERMKSERFKAELITNVSHDLKTPLTSIINYVDLLKKEHIENPAAQEYLDVLDRKSQRLKKLTEDLVEASKASTGTLTVNRERLGVRQLIDQATAEYGDRLASSQLEPVIVPNPEELYVWADGRHLWRILDNLLSNCCKYAMPGTRVYLDTDARGDQVTITMKNVSKAPLNVPASQLLERFVRGDESRTTEGSGLGLSIAQSLTELQGGSFTLTIDGDFFKAEVSLPRAGTLSRDAVL